MACHSPIRPPVPAQHWTNGRQTRSGRNCRDFPGFGHIVSSNEHIFPGKRYERQHLQFNGPRQEVLQMAALSLFQAIVILSSAALTLFIIVNALFRIIFKADFWHGWGPLD